MQRQAASTQQAKLTQGVGARDGDGCELPQQLDGVVRGDEGGSGQRLVGGGQTVGIPLPADWQAGQQGGCSRCEGCQAQLVGFNVGATTRRAARLLSLPSSTPPSSTAQQQPTSHPRSHPPSPARPGPAPEPRLLDLLLDEGIRPHDAGRLLDLLQPTHNAEQRRGNGAGAAEGSEPCEPLPTPPAANSHPPYRPAQRSAVL